VASLAVVGGASLAAGGGLDVAAQFATVDLQESLTVAAESVTVRAAGKLEAVALEGARLITHDAGLSMSGQLDAFAAAGAKLATGGDLELTAAATMQLRAADLDVRAAGRLDLAAMEEVTIDSGRAMKLRGGDGQIKLTSTPKSARVTILADGVASKEDEAGFVAELSAMLGVPAHRLRMVGAEPAEENGPANSPLVGGR
jgi:hypothetical protein